MRNNRCKLWKGTNIFHQDSQNLLVNTSQYHTYGTSIIHRCKRCSYLFQKIFNTANERTNNIRIIMVRQGDSKERALEGKKLARESCINFYKELKNASLLGKSILDLWLWEQGHRKGDLHTARQEHHFTHSSARRAQPCSTSMEEFVTAQVREVQIGILPAPDFLVGYTEQAWEDFLTHTRKPGRTRSRTLRNREPRGEREAWNKGDTTCASVTTHAFEGLKREEVLSVLVSCLPYRKGLLIS